MMSISPDQLLEKNMFEFLEICPFQTLTFYMDKCTIGSIVFYKLISSSYSFVSTLGQACPVKVWLGKLTLLDMTLLGCLGCRTSIQTQTLGQGWP